MDGLGKIECIKGEKDMQPIMLSLYKRFKDFLKVYIKRSEITKRMWIAPKIRRVENIFRNWQDFKVNYKKGIYEIIFDDSLGYLPGWDYRPKFCFDSREDAWKIIINDMLFYVKQFPLFELVNELRGYLLLGDLQNNGVILDAGPAAGISSMYFARRIGAGGRLVCIEPDKRVQSLLFENIRLNELNNVIVIKKGLFNKTGKGNMVVSNSLGGSSVNLANKNSPEIDLVDLKTVVNDCKLNKLNFMKVDIEGAEVYLLKDIMWLIEKNPQMIVAIASYHIYNKEKKTSSIIEEFFKNKFFCRTVYLYHETTFIVGHGNKFAKQTLSKLREYNENL